MHSKHRGKQRGEREGGRNGGKVGGSVSCVRREGRTSKESITCKREGGREGGTEGRRERYFEENITKCVIEI